MSGAVKQRAAAPSNNHLSLTHSYSQDSSDLKGRSGSSSNGSATLSYPSEASDDVNMNEVDGVVELDVVLPDGKHMDITVDYNTPMRDLLVCIAAKSKLSPPGLLLQLLSEDESILSYKPNEVIGALGGRQVRLINKKDKDANKNKNKGKKPFEMTNRFTVNLPRGQKAVVRVSPATRLGDLMTSICQDKDLDPRRHFLQLPGKPGIPIDLNSTVGQLGGFEISLISNSSVQERTIANSMPDLSQVPTYMPNAGETKKKRGFLSFLKKDRSNKFKPHDTLYETSSTASHKMSAQMYPPASNQRRVSDTGFESSRPKSMFVTSNASPAEFSLPRKENNNSLSQENIAPTRKKRRAPAPPTPSVTSETVSLPKHDINANDNNKEQHIAASTSSSSSSSSNNQRDALTAASTNKSQTASSRAEMLNRLHSRNSSDSSGYHELTLSGCESPEAGHTLASKSKTSIDSASIESSDINNGADSGIHESPVRVSPIEEVQEKPDASQTHIVSTLPHPHPPSSEKVDNNAIISTTLPLPSRKKKKAPAPPAPAPSVQQVPPTQQPTTHTSNTTVVAADINTALTTTITTADLHPETDHQYQSVQDSYESIEPTVSSEVAPANNEINPVVISPPDSFNDSMLPTQAVDASTPAYQMNEDPDLSDEDIDAAFDIDDILNGVTFDDEPKPLEIKTFSMLNNGVDEKGDRAMMMMETSSIASENIEQTDPISKSERPCAFIPPPPPTEPPPPEVEAVTVEGLNSSLGGPVLIDKGTEVNDDNTSLAPASMKNSPESDRYDPHHHHHHPYHHRTGSFSSMGSIDTIEGLNLDFQVAIRMGEESLNPGLDDVEVSQDGYKNEMALFVERMSKMATENPDSHDSNVLNDSLSSGLSLSESNSETGSVIQHLRTDSSDSRSGLEGSWSKKDAIKINGIEESEEPEDTTEMNVSEEITVPIETLPPPVEFGDTQMRIEDNIVDNDDDDDEEEEYTETIEELIIPLGPDGPDFTAARKVDDSENEKIVVSSSIEPEDTSIQNGVFRAEPVSIKPASSKLLEKERIEEQKKPVVQEKEEFILTTDDLSNVSFLPPRRKTSTSTPRSNTNSLYESHSNNSSSSAVLIMDKKATTPRDEESSTESIQNRMSQLSFTPKSEPENDSVLEVKPISLLNRPTMKPSAIRDSPQPYVVEDISVSVAPATHTAPSTNFNGDVLGTISNNKSSVPDHGGHDNVDSSSNPLNNSQSKDISDDTAERPGSQGLDSQHDMLQMQFAQWQEQLATNQSILSQATSNDLQSEQLQQLKAQMATQQSMMMQIQATMQSLQQQQVMNGGHGDKAASVEFPSVDSEQAAAAAEPPPPPPPPPPPAASSGLGTKPSEIASIKTGQNKNKSRPKPKFERELDPREQLMIAIRSFSGREGLKSVAKKDTKWIHSNR